jgi:hypothetical protein
MAFVFSSLSISSFLLFGYTVTTPKGKKRRRKEKKNNKTKIGRMNYSLDTVA